MNFSIGYNKIVYEFSSAGHAVAFFSRFVLVRVVLQTLLGCSRSMTYHVSLDRHWMLKLNSLDKICDVFSAILILFSNGS
jgi:hypothetical protein